MLGNPNIFFQRFDACDVSNHSRDGELDKFIVFTMRGPWWYGRRHFGGINVVVKTERETRRREGRMEGRESGKSVSGTGCRGQKDVSAGRV